MNELLQIGLERSRERFPEQLITPCSVWYSSGIFRCTVFVGNELASGVGKSINECVDNLIKSIDRIVNRSEEPVMHELL
jgi:hypothetical protein